MICIKMFDQLKASTSTKIIILCTATARQLFLPTRASEQGNVIRLVSVYT